MGMAFCATATTEKIAALAAKTSSRGIIQMRKFFVDVSFKAIEVTPDRAEADGNCSPLNLETRGLCGVIRPSVDCHSFVDCLIALENH
jgi:hypothetical protein